VVSFFLVAYTNSLVQPDVRKHGINVPPRAKSGENSVKNVPLDYDSSSVSTKQTIRYVTTSDQVRLAWARSGSGPSLVKASNWITHLEYDWESPVWQHWVRFLSEHFSLVRSDERGCGLSQRDVENVSYNNWLPDLESVIDAAKPERPFMLLGLSQGVVPAIQYAVKYPERVSHLILYGGYIRGWALSSNPDAVREGLALIEFTELGWGRSDPIYRRLFTRRFLPEGSEEQLRWCDDLCARAVAPKMAAELIRSRGDADATGFLDQVNVPTLVLHARGDQVAPLTQGQELAAGIPGAQFVQLESSNHILLENEPAWQRFCDAVLEFTGIRPHAESKQLRSLTHREKEILAKLVSGMTNAEIGRSLFISDKTVRNQLTRIFEKLGVSNRSQAIIFAKDRGF
jgi:pimeloyl-ACP methyl ester carboxylesterase/DNA-binding CsgD family transcriptional regulator